MKRTIAVTVAVSIPVVLLAAILYAASVAPVQAAPARPGPAGRHLYAAGDCTVTTTADDGPGSLRQCVLGLQPGSVITFDTTLFPVGSPATITLLSPLPAIVTDSVTIDGSGAGVILDGSETPDDTSGLVIDGATAVTIRGLSILRFPCNGIVLMNSASYNIIGGTNATPEGPCTGACNLLSSNGSYGVALEGADTRSNTVSGNFIGTNPNGTEALGNEVGGVSIVEGASNNVIGGDTPGERNLISGNLRVGPWDGTGFGIVIDGSSTTGNQVLGNYIGTDASGTAAIGNAVGGVVIRNGASYNVIGGDTSGERNVVSGNVTVGRGDPWGYGINIGGADTMGNTVIGNYVGTDATGTHALGNKGNGVDIGLGATGNTVGGWTPGERNLLSGNVHGGVLVWEGHGNLIIGNVIGTDPSGTLDLGNALQGVTLASGAIGNRVENNLISRNRGEGGILVAHSGTLQNTVTQNSIYSNTTKGIHLWLGGNLELFPPILTRVSALSVEGIAVPNATVEVFSDQEDEGRWFHGSTLADATGHFTFTSAVPFTGTNVTATATDSDGNTSEFSSAHHPGRDLSVVFLYAPQIRQQIQMPVTPMARVGNGGSIPETFQVTAVITRSSDNTRAYSATEAIDGLEPMHYRTIDFAPWIPDAFGDYVVGIEIESAGPDDNPTNDHIVQTIQVVHDQVDVWSRDHAADTGAEPSDGPTWQSPDLWVRNAPDGLSVSQDPINLIANTVYLRIRNRGTLTVAHATATLYWHPPSLAIDQSWWQPIDSMTITQIAPGEVHTAALEWVPQISDVLTEPFHTCLIGAVAAPEDPVPTYWDVGASNNIVQRNVDVIPAAGTVLQATGPEVTSTFRIGNPYPVAQLVDVVVDTRDMPPGSEMGIDLGQLFGRWQSFSQGALAGATIVPGTTQIAIPSGRLATISGLPLAAQEQFKVSAEIQGLSGRHGWVDISEQIGEELLGGLSIHAVGRFDVYLPLVLR